MNTSYKTAIIGVSGKRAGGHADAYEHVRRGRLASISSRNREKLDEFGDKYGIDRRYTDYREMLAKEKPDLVHVNTPPNVRLEVFEAAEEAGIKAVLIEKPIAIEGEDFKQIVEFAKTSNVKIAVNHQLQFHPRRSSLQEKVLAGDIGELRFIEASAGMNLAYQRTHALESIGAFQPEVKPVTVFGQIAGNEGLQDSPGKHFSPDQCLASIGYTNGMNAILRCGKNAPRVKEDYPVHAHKRIAVYGDNGYVYWTMWGWEIRIKNKYDSGDHDYWEEDVIGQANLTESMFDWLEDDNYRHPLRLELALQDFNIILGMYMSGLRHRLIELPVDPSAHLVREMREQLS